MERFNEHWRRLEIGVAPELTSHGARPLARRSGRSIWQAVAVGCLAIGCGSCGTAPAGPETIVVTGNVTLDGAPVKSADVAFIPLGAGDDAIPAQAVTNDAGEFEVVSVFDQGRTTKPGMLPGEYQVEVRQLLFPPTASGAMQPPKNSLPARYASANSSGFKVVVSPSDSNHFTLALTK